MKLVAKFQQLQNKLTSNTETKVNRNKHILLKSKNIHKL